MASSSSSPTESWRTTFAYDSKLSLSEEIGVSLHTAIERSTERVFALRRFELQQGLRRNRHQSHVRDVGTMLEELHEAPHVIAGGPTLWHKDLGLLEIHMEWYHNDLCERLNQTILLRGIIDNKLYVPSFYYDVMSQMADALKFVHKRGIIHRNVISSNIMYNNWEDRHFVLSGFSNATRTHPTNDRPCGHLSHMSPEMYAERAQTTAGDMWSLGVVGIDMGVTLPPPDPACYTKEGFMQSGWCPTLNELAKLCPMPELKGLLTMNPTKRMTADELCVSLPAHRVTTQRPLAVPDRFERVYVKLQVGNADESFIDTILEAPLRVHGKIFARPMACGTGGPNISVDSTQRLIRLNVSSEQAANLQSGDIADFAVRALMAGISHPQVGGARPLRPNANVQTQGIEEESSSESSSEDTRKTARDLPPKTAKAAKKSKKSTKSKKSRSMTRNGRTAGASAAAETRSSAPASQRSIEPSTLIETQASTAIKLSDGSVRLPPGSIEPEPRGVPGSSGPSSEASKTESVSTAGADNSELETKQTKQKLRSESSESVDRPQSQFETLAWSPLPENQTEISTRSLPQRPRTKPTPPQSAPSKPIKGLHSSLPPKQKGSSERKDSFSPGVRGKSASMSLGTSRDRNGSASGHLQEARRLPHQSKPASDLAGGPEHGLRQERDSSGGQMVPKPSLGPAPRPIQRAGPPDLQSSEYPPLLSSSRSDNREVTESRQNAVTRKNEPTIPTGQTTALPTRAEKAVVPRSSESDASVRERLGSESGSSPRTTGTQISARPDQRIQTFTGNGLHARSEADLGPSPRIASLPRGRSLEAVSNLQSIPESRTQSQSSTTSSHWVRNRLTELPEPISQALEVIEDDAECASPKWLQATQMAACYEVNHRTILRIADQIRQKKHDVKSEKLRHDAPAWFPGTGFQILEQGRAQSSPRSRLSEDGSSSSSGTRSHPPRYIAGSSLTASPSPQPQALRPCRQPSTASSSTPLSSPRSHVSLRPESRNSISPGNEVELGSSTVLSRPKEVVSQRAQQDPTASKFPPLVLRSSASVDLPKSERALLRPPPPLNRQISFKTALSGESRTSSSSSAPRQPSSQFVRTPSRSRLGDPSRQSSASSGAGIRSRQESQSFGNPSRSESQSAQAQNKAGTGIDEDDGEGPWLQPKKRRGSKNVKK